MSRIVRVCRALYDYEPQQSGDDGELALKEGCVIFILDGGADDGWLNATRDYRIVSAEDPTSAGVVGRVPGNYVEDVVGQGQVCA